MEHNRRGGVLAVVTALVAALLAAACGGGSGGSAEGASATAEQVLRVAWRANPSSLDPQRGNAGSDHAVLYTMFDTLVSFDPKTLEPAPGLAKSWDQSDPGALVLNLREGVTFHDGTPFDAEAVKYNIERAKGEKSNIQADVASIASVDVVDDHTVRFNLSRPDTSLLLTLADRAGMMVSPTAAEQQGEDFGRNPVGAGPWKFVEWRNGERVRVARYEDYWRDGLPHLDAIDFRIITDSSTAVNALRSGQQDMMFEPPPQEIDGLQSTPGLQVQVTPQLYQQVIYLDLSAEPLDDPRVRRALNLAIDRRSLRQATLFGKGEPAWVPVPSQHWSYPDQVVPTYPHDPAEARRLLAEAGLPGGFELPMLVYPTPTDIRRGEVVKEQLAEVGVEVELVPTELTQATDQFFNERKYPAYLSAWTGRPDPALTYKLMFTADAYYNAGHVETPGVAEALAAANATANLDERTAHLSDAARVVAEQALYVPLLYPPAVAVSADKVKGYVPTLLGKPKFTTVRIEQ